MNSNNMFAMAVKLSHDLWGIDRDYQRWIQSCEETSEAVSYLDSKEETLPECLSCRDRGCKYCLNTEW